MNAIGRWAFIIGLVIAVIAAFVSSYATIIALVLFVLGIVVGFLNINDKDVVKFLVAIIALAMVGVGTLNALSVLAIVNEYIKGIVVNFVAFVGAAGLVVSIKAVVEASR